MANAAVAVDLGLQRRAQHPPGTLGHDLIQTPSTSPRASAATTLNIGVTFRTGVPNAGARSLLSEEGTARPRPGGRSTGSGQTYEQIRR